MYFKGEIFVLLYVLIKKFMVITKFGGEKFGGALPRMPPWLRA